MMKKIILVSIIAAITFTTCKKSKVEESVAAPTPTVVGLWKGKYSLTINGTLDQDVIYYLKQDGTLRVFNSADTASANKAVGNWVKIDARVTCQYVYETNLAKSYGAVFSVDEMFTKTTNPTQDGWGLGMPLVQTLSYTKKGGVSLIKL